MSEIADHPSPNHDERNEPISVIVLHYTGMETGEAALEKLCDPDSGVSAHYLIREDGRILRLVPEERRAWHAGKSYWRGHTGINQSSIGIELVNPGHDHGYRDFPDAQIEALIPLLAEIKEMDPTWDAQCDARLDVARTQFPAEEKPGDGQEGVTR